VGVYFSDKKKKSRFFLKTILFFQKSDADISKNIKIIKIIKNLRFFVICHPSNQVGYLATKLPS